MSSRRRWLFSLPSLGSMLGGSAVAATAAAPAPARDRFPGDPPEHRIVYQLNHAENDHIEHILGSIGALIGRYEDNVAIAVVAFGPGIHLLARRPKRPIDAALRQRAEVQATHYGVRFIACGNTMKSLGWSAADMLPYARIEEVGAAALMELQEQGYAYIAW
jgi:hypothetical protein